MSDPHEEQGCTLCGKSLDEEWLSVEITRPDEQGNETWLHEVFCTQEHAAAWLAEPLPSIEATSPPLGWKLRLMNAVGVLVLVWAVALMLLGSYAFVRLLGGWD